MLPAPREKSRFERLKSFFIGLSSSNIPSHDVIQERSLEVYLTSHRKEICDCELSPSHLNIVQVANGVVHIFRQLFSQKIHQLYTSDWISEQLPKVHALHGNQL